MKITDIYKEDLVKLAKFMKKEMRMPMFYTSELLRSFADEDLSVLRDALKTIVTYIESENFSEIKNGKQLEFFDE